jgi:6-phospho-beta-glucosidase
MIGPSFAYSPAYPLTSKPEDILAFENAEAFTNDWWLDVYARGEYPDIPLHYLSERDLAPTIQDGDLDLLKKGIPDFIGVNYYKTTAYEANPDGGVSEGTMNTSGEKGSGSETGIPGLYKTARNPFVETTNWDWAIDPEGLRIGLRRIASRYGLPMMITENGLGDFDIVEPGERINDIARIEYLRAHIEQCKLAITDGVDLLGYCVWSFTDVLSWLNGYQKRYGLVYVNRDENDSKDLKRIPKQSYFWYKSLIESNRQRF